MTRPDIIWFAYELLLFFRIWKISTSRHEIKCIKFDQLLKRKWSEWKRNNNNWCQQRQRAVRPMNQFSWNMCWCSSVGRWNFFILFFCLPLFENSNRRKKYQRISIDSTWEPISSVYRKRTVDAAKFYMQITSKKSRNCIKNCFVLFSAHR